MDYSMENAQVSWLDEQSFENQCGNGFHQNTQGIQGTCGVKSVILNEPHVENNESPFVYGVRRWFGKCNGVFFSCDLFEGPKGMPGRVRFAICCEFRDFPYWSVVKQLMPVLNHLDDWRLSRITSPCEELGACLLRISDDCESVDLLYCAESIEEAHGLARFLSEIRLGQRLVIGRDYAKFPLAT